MKAYKYLETKEAMTGGVTYETRIFEKKDINLFKDDWDFIYNNIMCDDYECAYENGLYTDAEGDFVSLDCNKVSIRMVEWRKDQDEQGEEFKYFNDRFKKIFNSIYSILNANKEFIIDFEVKKE